MAAQELLLDLPALDLPPAADVAVSSGRTRWSVAECGWKKLLPELPDEVIALLATPVVVSAQALAPTATPAHAPTEPVEEPEEPERYPSPLEPCGTAHGGYGDVTPRFLAPALPRAARARHRG